MKKKKKKKDIPNEPSELSLKYTSQTITIDFEVMSRIR